jgi:hypothetical protein
MKPIRLSGHARENIAYRGTSEQEVVETITTSDWEDARQGRQECRRDFAFDSTWNGRPYHTKQVRPIFVDEPDEIVVITVYVYYF